MAHVVETGAGSSTANAYLTAAAADAYFADHGAPADWTGVDAVKEQAIRLATQYLDMVYGPRFKGTRKLSTQALQWPRYDVVASDGWPYALDTLPTPLLHACAEAALRSLQGDTLLPDLSAGSSAIDSESMRAGPVSYSVDYAGSASPYKTYSAIDALLWDLLQPGCLVERG